MLQIPDRQWHRHAAASAFRPKFTARKGGATLRRAVTLVELVLALTIVSLVSSAVAMMLAGAGKTHQYVNTETEAMSQVENAYRRILHNVRTASALTTPNDGTLHSPGTLTITTQA